MIKSEMSRRHGLQNDKLDTICKTCKRDQCRARYISKRDGTNKPTPRITRTKESDDYLLAMILMSAGSRVLINADYFGYPV